MLAKRIYTGIMITSLWMIIGCSTPSMPTDLINSPTSEVNIDRDNFSTMLRNILPTGARLLVSEHEKNSNGFIFGDVDGDGTDEAIVVYEENITQDKILKAAMLKQHKEEWQIIWDTKGFGKGLDYVGLSDVTNDAHPEIILGWSLGAGENGLDVYEWRNNTLNLWTKKGYQGQLDLNKIL